MLQAEEDKAVEEETKDINENEVGNENETDGPNENEGGNENEANGQNQNDGSNDDLGNIGESHNVIAEAEDGTQIHLKKHIIHPHEERNSPNGPNDESDTDTATGDIFVMNPSSH